jgi:hypothetical protein
VVVAGQARLLRGDATPVRIIDMRRADGNSAPEARNGSAAPGGGLARSASAAL